MGQWGVLDLLTDNKGRWYTIDEIHIATGVGKNSLYVSMGKLVPKYVSRSIKDRKAYYRLKE